MRHVIRITCQPGRELMLARQVAAARIPCPGRVHGQVRGIGTALPCGGLPGDPGDPGDPPIVPPIVPPGVPGLDFALASNSGFVCLFGGL